MNLLLTLLFKVVGTFALLRHITFHTIDKFQDGIFIIVILETLFVLYC